MFSCSIEDWSMRPIRGEIENLDEPLASHDPAYRISLSGVLALASFAEQFDEVRRKALRGSKQNTLADALVNRVLDLEAPAPAK